MAAEEADDRTLPGCRADTRDPAAAPTGFSAACGQGHVRVRGRLRDPRDHLRPDAERHAGRHQHATASRADRRGHRGAGRRRLAGLFLTLAKMRWSALPGRPLAAFGASTALVIGIGWYSAGRWFGRQPGERTIWAMAGGYVNSANLGIPIAMQLLGSISFLVEVVLLQVLVVTPIILIALDRHNAVNGRICFQRIVTLPGRNPVILASALGAVASVTPLHPPSALQTALTLLSSAAVPTALIALGASLSGQSMTGGRGEERDARTRPREPGF